MKQKILIIGAAVLVFLLALAMVLYPVISTRYNAAHTSEVYSQYRTQVEQIDTSEIDVAWEAAAAYNKMLSSGAQSYTEEGVELASNSYDNLLDLTGMGIMGYVEIPRISVELPIYHGTEDDALRAGVGHIVGSSLPIGGDSTHAVLSAHTGMAGKKMFTDLEQLQEGDVFYLQVLGEVLAYQVDQIKVVLPHETDDLQIVSSEDYCTLLTCTPYGINTHRLLVRGTRIPYEVAEEIVVEQDQTEEPLKSNWDQQYRNGIYVGLTLTAAVWLIILVAWAVLKCLKHRKNKKAQVENHE